MLRACFSSCAAGATNLMLSPMQFVGASGSAGSTITALGANQTLLGGAGDTLIGSTAFGDLFKGTAASMNHDIIRNFGGSDQIDITNILASKVTKLTWTPGTGGGVLSLSDGTHGTAVKIQGNYAASSFDFTTDNETGTLIKFT